MQDMEEGGSERRREERRSSSRPRLKYFLLGGRRKSPRRQSDRKDFIYVDQYHPWLIFDRARRHREKSPYGLVYEPGRWAFYDRQIVPHLLAYFGFPRFSKLLFHTPAHPRENHHTRLPCSLRCRHMLGNLPELFGKLVGNGKRHQA
jgi:hypothetical protein